MSEATETSIDQAESIAAPTSAEDKFFGVKTQIAKKSDQEKTATEQSDLDLEIIDDKPPSKKAAEEPTGDEELDQYSASVRKRLDKATYKRREAERLANEAVKIGSKALWLQYGIKNEEAEKIAENSKILYVSNKCIKQEYQRLFQKANPVFPVLKN